MTTPARERELLRLLGAVPVLPPEPAGELARVAVHEPEPEREPVPVRRAVTPSKRRDRPDDR